MGCTSSRLDGNPLEAFVRDSDIKAGGLGDNGCIRAPRFDQRIGAEARMLLVGNCRDDEPASIQTAAFSNATRGAHYRSHAAFHVLRPAAEQLAIANLGFERARHPRNTDGVRMAAQNQRSTVLAAFEHANDVRSPWCRFGNLDRETVRAQFVGQTASDVGLAARARHERGIH